MPVRPPPFHVFLEQHRDDVYRFLRAMAGPQEADDCFQETFLAALRAYPRLDADSNMRGWVLTIAHRKALDVHRVRKRSPVPRASLPERAMIDPTQDGAVWQAVRDLPPKQRAAVVHRFANDLTYRDIGVIVGCTEEAARRSVFEGLKKLRETWTP